MIDSGRPDRTTEERRPREGDANGGGDGEDHPRVVDEDEGGRAVVGHVGTGGGGGRGGVGDSLGHEMDRWPDGWLQEVEGAGDGGSMGSARGHEACENKGSS